MYARFETIPKGLKVQKNFLKVPSSVSRAQFPVVDRCRLRVIWVQELLHSRGLWRHLRILRIQNFPYPLMQSSVSLENLMLELCVATRFRLSFIIAVSLAKIYTCNCLNYMLYVFSL